MQQVQNARQAQTVEPTPIQPQAAQPDVNQSALHQALASQIAALQQQRQAQQAQQAQQEQQVQQAQQVQQEMPQAPAGPRVQPAPEVMAEVQPPIPQVMPEGVPMGRVPKQTVSEQARADMAEPTSHGVGEGVSIADTKPEVSILPNGTVNVSERIVYNGIGYAAHVKITKPGRNAKANVRFTKRNVNVTNVILLLKSDKVKGKYKDDLKKKILYFSDIDTVELSQVKWESIRFQRHNLSYRPLLNVCHLIAKGLIMTTEKGEYKFATFVDDQRMCRLYEKFVLEYYRRHYPDLSPKPARISWAVDDGIDTLLPTMQTDIHLQQGNKVLIIDTKYYSKSMQANYDKYTLHSHNLYQIFAYVKNRAHELGEDEHSVSGLLLYAKTEDRLQPDQSYQMSGNKISVRTLDLNRDFEGIASQLNQIVEEHFG